MANTELNINLKKKKIPSLDFCEEQLMRKFWYYSWLEK